MAARDIIPPPPAPRETTAPPPRWGGAEGPALGPVGSAGGGGQAVARGPLCALWRRRLASCCGVPTLLPSRATHRLHGDAGLCHPLHLRRRPAASGLAGHRGGGGGSGGSLSGVSRLPPARPAPQSPHHVLEKVSASTVTLTAQTAASGGRGCAGATQGRTGAAALGAQGGGTRWVRGLPAPSSPRS